MTAAASAGQTTGLQVWYTYCRLLHAGNVDTELGRVSSELARHGARLDYFMAAADHDFLPHFTHNLEALFRYGGCIPAIHAKADLHDTVLLGLQWVNERGGLLVRSTDDLRLPSDLRGKRIGLSQSRNPRKVDYRRVTEERGIELMLRLNAMTRDDVTMVDCPFADDWYDGPVATARLNRPVDLWQLLNLPPDARHQPLRAELLQGTIDACFVTDPCATMYADTGDTKLIESLGRYPDWTLQVGGAPYALTCTRTFADAHPELVVAYLKGLIRTGRWCNAHHDEAAALLDRTGFYPPRDALLPTMERVDFVPNLSRHNLAAAAIEAEFMRTHGYIAHDVDVRAWAAPEFLAAAEGALAEELSPPA